MSELTPEEKRKIYEEEKARVEAQEHIKRKISRKTKPSTWGCLILIILIVIVISTSILKTPKGTGTDSKRIPITVVSNETDFKNAVNRIFEQPKDSESSGFVQILYDKTDSAIHYNFFPLGLFKYENELGVDLVPKIKKLYEVGGDFNNITFLIRGLFQDQYGNTKWLPVLSFEFTRAIYNKINWQNFLNEDLLNVAKNVKWFRQVR